MNKYCSDCCVVYCVFEGFLGKIENDFHLPHYFIKNGCRNPQTNICRRIKMDNIVHMKQMRTGRITVNSMELEKIEGERERDREKMTVIVKLKTWIIETVYLVVGFY